MSLAPSAESVDSNDRSGTWQWLWLAFIVLAISCIGRVVRCERLFALPKPGDGPVYENIAFHLASGRGFWVDWKDAKWRAPYESAEDGDDYSSYLTADQSMPMTGRPPVLPVVIASVYGITGRNEQSFAIVRLILAACIAIAGALAVANAAKLLSSARLGEKKFSKWSIRLGCIGAILLAASNRTLHSYAEDFLTEPLALLFTQLLVTALLWLQSRQQFETDRPPFSFMGTVAISGLLALMILVRSLFVTWLPGIAALLLLISPKHHRWRIAGTILFLTLIFMAPWWSRNCYVLQRFMPLGTQGPITMLGGYCDEALAAGGDWQHAPELRLRQQLASEPSFQAFPSDVQRELVVVQESKRLVRSWIYEHVRDLPSMFISRIVIHWNPYTGKSLVWRILILIGVTWLLIRRRPESWILIGLPVMNTLLVAAMYTTGGRFLVPLYGVLFSLSAIGIAVLVEVTLVAWFCRTKMVSGG